MQKIAHIFISYGDPNQHYSNEFLSQIHNNSKKIR